MKVRGMDRVGESRFLFIGSPRVRDYGISGTERCMVKQSEARRYIFPYVAPNSWVAKAFLSGGQQAWRAISYTHQRERACLVHTNNTRRRRKDAPCICGTERVIRKFYADPGMGVSWDDV